MTDTDTEAVARNPKTAAPQQVPDLAADLDAGLRRLKLAAIRRTAPEVLLTAKTQRWTPEEVLRTLVESEARRIGVQDHCEDGSTPNRA